MQRKSESYWIECDDCRQYSIPRLTPAEARAQARQEGYVRKKLADGKMYDLCGRCDARRCSATSVPKKARGPLPIGPHGIHKPESCAGQHCPFHNPSKHHMVTWNKVIRETGLVERVCSHGVGHPDPDSVAYAERFGEDCWGIHGCDGCCDPKKERR